MRLSEYQFQAQQTSGASGAIYPQAWCQCDSSAPLPHGAMVRLITGFLGLAGEAGECADLLKKHLGHGHVLDRDRTIKELGDVLWYVSECASVLGIDLATIAEANLEKLKRRYPNGFSSEASRNRQEAA